ncbi:MAG: pseudouridine synthase [Sulfuricella sp.]|nr:pseudouridine synthase [Sulfuricella sp.]
MELERILRSQGFGSKKTCRALIRSEAVTVEGVPCDDPFAEFTSAGLNFTVDGEAWQYREKAYLLLNKPAGYECSNQPIHHPSVFALLPPPMQGRGMQCVGRLDEDTTGLLLFSDDGQFIHRMASPKWKMPKVYRVTLKHPADDAQVAALTSGVQLHDEPAPLAAVACERIDERVLLLTLTEGKYHQVKRMIGAAGNRVEALQRVSLGTMTLPADLPEGAWRWLDAERDLAGMFVAR